MERRKVGQDMVVKKSGHRLDVSRKIETHQSPRRAEKPIQPVIQKIRPEPVPVPREKPQPRIDDSYTHTSHEYHRSQQQPPVRGGILWIFVSISILILVYSLSAWLAHATISVTLNQESYPINIPVTIFQEPADGQVGFKTARVTDTESIVVPSTTKQPITSNASGTVKIFSTLPAVTTVPAGTHLVSTSGKEFITKSAITIPAGSKTKITSKDVVITAVAAGADSNIGRDDLKLPAFPGLVARTTTDIAGGALGNEFTITDAQLAAAKSSLLDTLSGSHPAQFLAKQIPEGYIVPESLTTAEPVTFKTESVDTGVKVIGERAVTGVMIDQSLLEHYLDTNVIPVAERPYMHVSDMKNIVITYEATPTGSLDTLPSVSLHITGSFVAQAGITPDHVREITAAKKVFEARTALQAEPGVISSTIRMMPPWIRRIPTTISAISVAFQYQTVQ